MKTTVEKISSNKVKISFVIEAEQFEKGMQSAYRKNVGRISIPGFRKGKAPRKVIEAQYGEAIFYEDAVDAIFPELYDQAISENKLEPVDRPSLEVQQIGSGKDLEFTVEVFVKPEVTLGQYKGIEAEKHQHAVDDEAVKAEIERARERVSRYIEVEDRPVKLDDQVTINYAGFCEGEQFEGGTAQGQKLVIGSGNFIPGFEDQLVGAEVGKEVEVNVTFPEKYHAENLAGKPATFKVTVTEIQEKEVPELDDEFAKDVSDCDTLEEYRAQTKEKLQKQADERADVEFENAVVEQAVENAQMDIPEPMVESQVTSMLRDMEMRMMYQGLRMEDYLKYTGQTMEQMRETQKEEAERRVRTQLVLDAIAQAESIEADEESMDKEIAKYAEQSKKSVEDFKKGLSSQDMEYLAAMVKVQKTVDFLKAEAVVKPCDCE